MTISQLGRLPKYIRNDDRRLVKHIYGVARRYIREGSILFKWATSWLCRFMRAHAFGVISLSVITALFTLAKFHLLNSIWAPIVLLLFPIGTFFIMVAHTQRRIERICKWCLRLGVNPRHGSALRLEDLLVYYQEIKKELKQVIHNCVVHDEVAVLRALELLKLESKVSNLYTPKYKRRYSKRI